jgi:hypothetical protein
MRRHLLAAAFLLAPAGPAHAGVIYGYDPASQTSHDTYDRFSAGFPNQPIPNASPLFVGAGVDLTGVGWHPDDPRFAVTMISPQHFVTAAHVGAGSTVNFANAAGQVHSYTVQSSVAIPTTFTNAQGQQQTLPSDLLLGTLSAPIPAADGIRYFGVLGVNETQATGLPILAHGQNPSYVTPSNPTVNPHLGRNTIDTVGLTSFNNFATEATRVMTYDWTPGNPGEFYLIGGDSGGPSFVRVGNDFALVGVHYGVSNATTTPNPGDISADSFVPDYIQGLNNAMASTPYQVTVVPVPEPVGVLAAVGLAVAAGLVRRRLRTGRWPDRGRRASTSEPRPSGSGLTSPAP